MAWRLARRIKCRETTIFVSLTRWIHPHRWGADTLNYIGTDLDNPLPFKSVKPIVQNLVREQQSLCNQIIADVKKGFEDESLGEEAERALIADLYRVKLGMPKHKQLLRMMEEPKIRKALDQVDLELNSDFKKEERFALKESLFFYFRRKTRTGWFDRKGALHQAPMIPMPSCCQIYLHLWRLRSSRKSLKASKRQTNVRTIFKTRVSAFTVSVNSWPTVCMRRTKNMLSKTEVDIVIKIQVGLCRSVVGQMGCQAIEAGKIVPSKKPDLHQWPSKLFPYSIKLPAWRERRKRKRQI